MQMKKLKNILKRRNKKKKMEKELNLDYELDNRIKYFIQDLNRYIGVFDENVINNPESVCMIMKNAINFHFDMYVSGCEYKVNIQLISLFNSKYPLLAKLSLVSFYTDKSKLIVLYNALNLIMQSKDLILKNRNVEIYGLGDTEKFYNDLCSYFATLYIEKIEDEKQLKEAEDDNKDDEDDEDDDE